MLYKALFTLAGCVSDGIGSKRRFWGSDIWLSTEGRMLYSPKWLESGSRSIGRPERKRDLGTF